MSVERPSVPVAELAGDVSAAFPRVVAAAPKVLRKISELPPEFRESARRVRAQYGGLYEEPVYEQADGRRTFDQGVLYRRHGFNVLFLKGTQVEMAIQHARLLSDQIPFGAVEPAARLVEWALANAFGKFGPLQRLLWEGIDRFITRAMLGCSSRAAQRLGDVESLDEAVALSDAMGIPVMTLVRSLFNPEVLMIMLKIDSDSRRLPVPLQAGLGVPISCSSFAAWGSHTAGGGMMIGRNMDYPLNGYFDRFPTVIYAEPTGAEVPHMTFVSAGVHTFGLHGYNEAGLFVSSHTIPSSDVGFHGVPVFATANRILRQASSYEMAVELFRRSRPPSGWGYLVASTREGRVGSVEMSNGEVAVRESQGDFHVQTNHYLTPRMREKNLFVNTSVAEDNDGRFLRIKERLQDFKSTLDAKSAMSILGDQVDPYVQEVRGIGSTVGVHTTMSSIVIDAWRRRVWVASGTAPVSHNSYVAFPLVGTVDRDEFGRQFQDAVECHQFRDRHPEKMEALQFFIAAKAAYEYENDSHSARTLLRKAAHTDPDPAYYFQLGIFSLRCGDYGDALDAFDDVLSRLNVTAQLRRLAHYYRGRVLAHQGHADAALSELALVLDDPQTDKKLRASAASAVRATRFFGRCRLRQRSLTIMMQQSDMLHY